MRMERSGVVGTLQARQLLFRQQGAVYADSKGTSWFPSQGNVWSEQKLLIRSCYGVAVGDETLEKNAWVLNYSIKFFNILQIARCRSQIDGFLDDYAFLIKGLLTTTKLHWRRCIALGKGVAGHPGQAFLGRAKWSVFLLATGCTQCYCATQGRWVG